ncbi:hypothetical protein L3X38_005414 [Prunus dulcis]|uniref:TMV resistance protein N-like n=1 Tax=Prunus dulcis TaxID=3755 RepID=A0AAD4ZQP5_PRUDU|nr:hypothetical protein L3X38_005414 [Prunus dulcis]
MEKVGGIAGYIINTSKEADGFIQHLVQRVLTEINKTPAVYTVGLDSRVEEVMRLLDLNVGSSGVRVLGIHGMGGVGKTTLANTLFNRLVGHFDCHCLISNVREISAGHEGLLSLQNKLIGNLSPNKVPPVNELETGVAAIRAIVYEKQILLVLDDVDNVSQLSALVGNNREWFYKGSRIIVTTRDIKALPSHLVNKLYELRELDSSKALQLFNYHALRREKPTDEFFNLSREIAALTGGLPLALEVFGSYLFDKTKIEDWREALQKLSKIRPGDLHDVLKISYDALDKPNKYIFLDIACLFVKMNMKREDAINILKGCGFAGEIAISDLTAKSLIKITEDSTLWMHDQIRDMGRQIVRDENLLDPGMRTRLWDRDEIMNVFKDDKGTRHIQGIVLDFESRTMKETWKFLPAELKWLQWKGCPLKSLALDFFPLRLAILDLSDSKLERLWRGRGHKVAEKLMLLNLTGCFNLTGIPDLSGNGALEKLILEHCTGLTKLHNSIGNLQTLVHLNLRECSNLIQLPNDVSGLTKLENLILSGCLQLKQLPNNMDRMVSLKELLLDDTAIISLPESIFRLTKLEKLSLNRCKYLKGLPDLIGKLCSLKEISLNGCEKLEKIPYSMGSLANLEKLSLLWCTSLSIIPDSIGNLKSLMEFYIYGSPIKELPVSIGSLSNLKELSTGNCQFLSRLPDSIGGLNSLVVLKIDKDINHRSPT